MKTVFAILIVAGCSLGLLIYLGFGLYRKLQLDFGDVERATASNATVVQEGSKFFVTFEFKTAAAQLYRLKKMVNRHEANAIEQRKNFEIVYLKSDPSVIKIAGDTDFMTIPMIIGIPLLIFILYRAVLVVIGKLPLEKFY